MFHPSAIHVVIVVLVIVLIFGAAKLPSVAKNLGKSMKVFRDEVKDLGHGDKPDDSDGPASDAEDNDSSASAKNDNSKSSN